MCLAHVLDKIFVLAAKDREHHFHVVSEHDFDDVTRPSFGASSVPLLTDNLARERDIHDRR